MTDDLVKIAPPSAPAKNPVGNPTKKTQELCDTIIDQIIEGKSLVKILKNLPSPLNYSTFTRWLASDEELSTRYAEAKRIQADYLAEELLDIADDGSNDWMASNDPENPGYKVNQEYYQRSRLRLDTRKWIASKLRPMKYGDRVTHGGDSDAPIVLKCNIPNIKDSDE